MKDTLKFFEIAKPLPLTSEDAQVQLGVHLEEITEMLEDGLGLDDVLIDELNDWSGLLKSKRIGNVFGDMDKITLLDSLADQYVTLIGTARALGFDIEGAVKEVEASNLSKFYFVGVGQISDLEWIDINQQKLAIEAQGRYKGVYWERLGEYVVFFDENGKILKCPKTYFEPDLTKFIGE
jgi:hypothetical protein